MKDLCLIPIPNMESEEFMFNSKIYYSYQLIRIKWKNQTPFFELLNMADNTIKYICALSKFNLDISSSRKCLGSYELGTHALIVCKGNHKLLPGQKVCAECENANGFKYCLACHGERCVARNTLALAYCNQKHFVYLAFFPDSIVKVGTAHYLRKEDRLVEQGALYRIFVAVAPTGKIARQIEKAISILGYKTAVSAKHKINNLVINRNEEEIESLLKDAYIFVCNNIGEEYQKYMVSEFSIVKSPVVIDKMFSALACNTSSQLSFLEQKESIDYHVLNDISRVSGEVVILAMVGTIALLKDYNGILFAFDFKKAYGNLIHIAEEKNDEN